MSRRMLLVSALLALAGPAGLPANGIFHKESSQLYALSAHGRVSLRNINGDVHIRAWDRDAVRIIAVETAPTKGLLDEALVLVDSTPGAISIHTRYAGVSATDPGSVEFTLMVPRHARLSEIKLINGAVDIEGVRGGVNASSVNGPVRAREIGGDARLSTVNGRLEASFEGLLGAHSISMNSINGPISLFIPYNARAEFKARNVTGGIDNDFGFPVRRDGSAGSELHGVLKGGGTYISLRNVNGAICITPMDHGRRVKFT